MTLLKTKPTRPTMTSRKRVGQHHHVSRHYVKTYWPYLPIIAILSFGVLMNTWLGNLHKGVLGYATDLSASSLLVDTNAQRTNYHEAQLSLNTQLTKAAQAKATDMATRNYWSHNTPDGKTPWSFITASGYDYQTAGENLAYGFTSAANVLAGWMNSPEHRANVLNQGYRNVGFGIVNIPDYQHSGPETLVVAMYGSPAGSITTATSPVLSAPVAIATAKGVTLPTHTVEPQTQHIARIQLASGFNSWGLLTCILLGVAGCMYLLVRHGLAWRKVLVRSDQFVLHHPLLDITAASFVTLSILASHVTGIIK